MKKRTIILDELNRKKADNFFGKYELKININTNIKRKIYLGENFYTNKYYLFSDLKNVIITLGKHHYAKT